MNQFTPIQIKYTEFANVNISGLINAIGALPDYWTLNNRGHREFRSESELYCTNKSDKLGVNAGILYLYLHILGPQKDGKVTLFLDDAVNYTHRSKRTVSNNLKTLQRKGYIYITPGALDDTYTIYITHYKYNAFAKSDSRYGYIVLSKDTLDSIVEIKDINTFRFAVRGLLNQVPGKQNSGMCDGCTYKEIKTMFPGYILKTKVLDLMQNKSIKQLFNISASESLKYFKIRPKTICDALALKKKRLSVHITAVKKIFSSMNLKYTNNIFKLSDSEIRDVGYLLFQYSTNEIKQAANRMFANYTRPEVKSVPALIRTLII